MKSVHVCSHGGATARLTARFRQVQEHFFFIFVHLKKTFLRDVEKPDAKWSWSPEAAQTVASKEKKIHNNNLEHKCLIILMPTTDQMW